VVTTLLIVDDHPSFRANARELLEAEGYDVIGEAEDGASAPAAIHELRPDVVRSTSSSRTSTASRWRREPPTPPGTLHKPKGHP